MVMEIGEVWPGQQGDIIDFSRGARGGRLAGKMVSLVVNGQV